MTSAHPIRFSGYVATLVVALAVASVAYANAARVTRVFGGWSDAGTLADPRAYASTTVLPDGTVLLVGGLASGALDRASTTAELFEPLTGRSAVLPGQILGRLHHSATFVDGKVVVAGGVELRDETVAALDRTDVYDVKTRTWTVAGSLRSARSDFGATLLADGRIFVTGGHDGPKMLATSEIFDLATAKWTSAAPLPVARTQFTTATLPDGRILVAGGLEFPGIPSATSLLYDPVLDKWIPGPAMSVARVLHTDVQLPNGDVVLIGGQRAAGTSAELFDAQLVAFRRLADLVEPRMLAQSAVLDDGSIVVTGGLSPDESVDVFAPLMSAERFDPRAGLFQMLPAPADARALGALLVIGEGLYQIGGVETGELPARRVERLGYR